LAWRKLVDGGHRLRGGILGTGHAHARERQRQHQRAMSGSGRRVYALADGTTPWNENRGKKRGRWPGKATGSRIQPVCRKVFKFD
jgi:hypothetical protein